MVTDNSPIRKYSINAEARLFRLFVLKEKYLEVENANQDDMQTFLEVVPEYRFFSNPSLRVGEPFLKKEQTLSIAHELFYHKIAIGVCLR